MPRGGARTGAGRTATDCPGEPLYTYSFTIRLEDTGVLNRFGHGHLRLGLRRLIDLARAAAVMPARSPAHDASPSGQIRAEAMAGDKEPFPVRQDAGISNTTTRHGVVE